jgi:hypothetical protein
MAKSKRSFEKVKKSVDFKANADVSHHLYTSTDRKHACKGWADKNCCLFMSLYLSYDEKVRRILRNNVPDTDDPTEYFRQVNCKRDGGKHGKGDGFDLSHLIRLLDTLKERGMIAYYNVFRVGGGKLVENPIKFLTFSTVNKKVGSRYLLFGSAPRPEWNKGVETQLRMCTRSVKLGKNGVYCIDPEYSDRVSSIESDIVLKRENEMFTEITNRNKYHSLKTNTHCSCVAYYPVNLFPPTRHHWKTTGLVPILFDNGKEKYKECSAAELIKTNVNIRQLYSVFIALPGDEKV